METKFTKGEWDIHEINLKDYRQLSVVSHSEKTVICHFYLPEGIIEQEHKANAKVVSCAPEMLESLKELLRFKAELRRIMGYRLESPENFLKAIEAAEKLIKKASENL